MATTNTFTTSTAGTTTATPSKETFNLSGLQDSTDWKVDPATQTVSGQLSSVIASNSPLMQQARTRATEAMNSRGLANTSMALGAADSAMYDAALPIAQGNAQVYADAGKTNAAQKNQFSMAANNQAYDIQKMGINQDYDLQKMQVAQTNNLETLAKQYNYDIAKMDAQTRNTLSTMTVEQQNRMATLAVQQGYDLSKMNLQQTLDLAKLDKQTAAAIQVADIEAVYKNLTQGSASATTILTKMQDSLNALTANKDLSDASRTQMAADIKTNAMEALNLIGGIAGDVDLTSYISQVGL